MLSCFFSLWYPCGSFDEVTCEGWQDRKLRFLQRSRQILPLDYALDLETLIVWYRVRYLRLALQPVLGSQLGQWRRLRRRFADSAKRTAKIVS